MDLSKLNTRERSEQGAVLTIVDPKTRTPFLGYNDKPVTITLKGADCRAFKEMQYRQSDKAFKGGRLKMSSAELAESSIQTLAKMTISWEGVSVNGEELPCTEANAAMVYREYEVVRAQVDEFVNDIENYLGND